MRSKFFITILAPMALLLSTTVWPLESSDIQNRSALEQKSTNGIQLQPSAEDNLTNKQQENTDKTPKPATSNTNEALENNAVTRQKPRTPKRSIAVKRNTEKDVLQQNTMVTADPIIIEDKAASNKALEMEAHLKQLEQQINTLQNVQENAERVTEQTTPPLEAVLQPYFLPAIAFIIGIISLLGWQKWRNYEPKKSFYTESLIIAAKSSPLPEPVDATPIPVIKAEATLEFLAELNILNANQNAVNLLTEVDIYISHGYYQKAEELLRRAMQQQPIRDEYKLKLLKTYYTSGNKSQFSNYINELDDAGKLKEHLFWDNIADMVKALIPDSPLLKTHKSLISEQNQQDLNGRVAQETLDDELEYDFDFSALPVAKSTIDEL